MNAMHVQHTEFSREFENSHGQKSNRILMEEDFRRMNIEKFNLLTRREKEIIRLILNDLNNPQIAKKLFISRYTVEQHRKNINQKLQVHSPFQLYKFALAFNLVDY